jgi:hypothetical protein
MTRLLFCVLIVAAGFAGGYVTHEYQDVHARMTKFADLYECCSGAAMAKARYSSNANELAEVVIKGKNGPLVNFDLQRLAAAWLHATDSSHASAKAGWVATLEKGSFARVDALLKEGQMSPDDVQALAELYESRTFSPAPALTDEQKRQLAYLLERAPDLAIVLTAAQTALSETVRRQGTVPLDLSADPMVNTFRSPFDLVALCQIRPDIVTDKKNSSFRECVRTM